MTNPVIKVEYEDSSKLLFGASIQRINYLRIPTTKNFALTCELVGDLKIDIKYNIVAYKDDMVVEYVSYSFFKEEFEGTHQLTIETTTNVHPDRVLIYPERII